MIETNHNESLQRVASLQEFFRDSMQDALASQRVEVEEHTAHYVINLLTLFARSEKFYRDDDSEAGLKPLALQLNDALNAPSWRQRRDGLRRLGDVALFVAGFFAGSFRDRAVDIDYYIAMGGTAYGHLSDIVRDAPQSCQFAFVYDELSEKFHALVDVLNEVSEQGGQTADNAVRLYNIWQHTGSRRAARMLRQQGIFPLHADARATRQ